MRLSFRFLVGNHCVNHSATVGLSVTQTFARSLRCTSATGGRDTFSEMAAAIRSPILATVLVSPSSARASRARA
ncbi:hypothetical protein [Kibdelosporangium philippinense]|uniref:hypothetical protein n=1 Tax=Kibdelosporangium philippinense TaxID=211113 RepID=UPI00362262D7